MSNGIPQLLLKFSAYRKHRILLSHLLSLITTQSEELHYLVVLIKTSDAEPEDRGKPG